MVAFHASATGDLACNPVGDARDRGCPDWELNWQSFGSQAGTQPTGPHQPGINVDLEQLPVAVNRVQGAE